MRTQRKINKNVARKKDVTRNIENNEMQRLGILVAIVTGIFIIFYAVTFLLMREKENYDYIQKISTKRDIQYDEILISQILNQSPKEYYVFIKENDDINNSIYDVYIGNYRDYNKDNNDGLKIYTLNIDKIFNKANKSDESYFNTVDVNEIKVKQATILKISNKQIVEIYEGEEKITRFFEEILKKND